MKNFNLSTSERNGVALIQPTDRQIRSIGISTAGVAEIEMARQNPDCHITASTVDGEGLAFAQDYIAREGLTKRIDAIYEDIVNPREHEGYFDFTYARLVFHYLSHDDLNQALRGVHETMRPGSKLFSVVRSTECGDADTTQEGTTYNPLTRFTSHTSYDKETGEPRIHSRYFHTQESINGHLAAAGFRIVSTQSYWEQLYSDFKRQKVSGHLDHLVETVAEKVS